MARSSSKNPFGLVFILLLLGAISAYMTYKYTEEFREIDCLGVTCPEGQFCQKNKCRNINA